MLSSGGGLGGDVSKGEEACIFLGWARRVAAGAVLDSSNGAGYGAHHAARRGLVATLPSGQLILLKRSPHPTCAGVHAILTSLLSLALIDARVARDKASACVGLLHAVYSQQHYQTVCKKLYGVSLSQALSCRECVAVDLMEAPFALRTQSREAFGDHKEHAGSGTGTDHSSSSSSGSKDSTLFAPRHSAELATRGIRELQQQCTRLRSTEAVSAQSEQTPQTLSSTDSCTPSIIFVDDCSALMDAAGPGSRARVGALSAVVELWRWCQTLKPATSLCLVVDEGDQTAVALLESLSHCTITMTPLASGTVGSVHGKMTVQTRDPDTGAPPDPPTERLFRIAEGTGAVLTFAHGTQQ